MRWLINYLRQCFCKHDFELLYRIDVYDAYDGNPTGYKLVYRCEKCGYVQKVRM